VPNSLCSGRKCTQFRSSPRIRARSTRRLRAFASHHYHLASNRFRAMVRSGFRNRVISPAGVPLNALPVIGVGNLGKLLAA
jgi:hypothetical protein